MIDPSAARLAALSADLAALPPLPAPALAEFKRVRGHLVNLAAERVAVAMRNGDPERWAAQRTFVDDLAARFGDLLASVYALALFSALATESLWHLSAFAARGLHAGAYRSLVDGWVMAIQGTIKPPEGAALVLPLEILRRHIADLAVERPPRLPTHLDAEAQALLEHLLAQDRAASRRLLGSLLDAGRRPIEVLDTVVMPCLREIGARWQHDEMGVVEEHAASEAVQYLLAQIGGRGAASPLGLRALVACVPGEEHVLGTTALVAGLESEGWEVVQLGRSMPQAELMRAVGKYGPQAFFLSVTLVAHLPAAVAVATEVRRLHPEIRLFFGGSAAHLGRDALRPHADGIVATLTEAHAVAAKLLRGRA